MSGFANPIAGGGGALAYPAIHSPGYVPGSAGWSVRKDGSAEFADVTLRGSFAGTNWIIDAGGIFFYNGPPAPGSLVLAISQGGGVDPYGNIYGAGLWLYDTSASEQVLAVGPTSGQAQFGPGSAAFPGVLIDPPAAIVNSVPVYAWAPGVATTETWHSMAVRGYQHGWKDSGAGPVGQYRLTPAPAKCAELVGDLTAGTVADGTVVLNLPNAYHPVSPQLIPVLLPGAASAEYYLSVAANGNVTCTGMSGLTTPRVIIPAGTLISLDA